MRKVCLLFFAFITREIMNVTKRKFSSYGKPDATREPPRIRGKGVEDLNRHFFKENTQTASKYTQRCSRLTAIRETHMKTTDRTAHPPGRRP